MVGDARFPLGGRHLRPGVVGERRGPESAGRRRRRPEHDRPRPPGRAVRRRLGRRAQRRGRVALVAGHRTPPRRRHRGRWRRVRPSHRLGGGLGADHDGLGGQGSRVPGGVPAHPLAPAPPGRARGLRGPDHGSTDLRPGRRSGLARRRRSPGPAPAGRRRVRRRTPATAVRGADPGPAPDDGVVGPGREELAVGPGPCPVRPQRGGHRPRGVQRRVGLGPGRPGRGGPSRSPGDGGHGHRGRPGDRRAGAPAGAVDRTVRRSAAARAPGGDARGCPGPSAPALVVLGRRRPGVGRALRSPRCLDGRPGGRRRAGARRTGLRGR